MRHGTVYEASDDAVSIAAGWLAALLVGAAVLFGAEWALRHLAARVLASMAFATMFGLLAYGIGVDLVHSWRMDRLDRLDRKADRAMKSERDAG